MRRSNGKLNSVRLARVDACAIRRGVASDNRDPIAAARANWERSGWGDVSLGMVAVTSVMRAHQILLARVETALRPYDLSFSRFELLRLLAFSRIGALPITKASDRLQVHVTSVTHAIRRLEADGLVRRVPHPTDGRTTLVQITELGRSTVEDSGEPWGTFINLRCVCLAPPYASHDTLAMVVVGRDGSQTRLATWLAEPGHTATPAGSISTPVDQIAAVQVVAADTGQVLLQRSL